MHPLDGPRRKLDRAREHIQTLNEAMSQFYKSKPVRLTGDFNAEKTAYIYRCEVAAIPIYLGIVASDILHNLRSSLDHLTWQLALITTQTPSRITAFPIFKTENDISRREINRLLADVPKDARDVIELLQPYRTPQPFQSQINGLWILHELSNVDKHQMITIHTGMVEIAFETGMSEDWLDDHTIKITIPVLDQNLPPPPPKMAYYVAVGRGTIGNGIRVEAFGVLEKYIREIVLPKFERFFPKQVE